MTKSLRKFSVFCGSRVNSALLMCRWGVNWWRAWGTAPVLSWIVGAKHFRAGDYRTALRYYEKGLNRHLRHPARICAELDRAYCLLQLGLAGQAIRILQLLIDTNTPPRDAFVIKARAHTHRGEFPLAEQTLRGALRVFPADGELHALHSMAVLSARGPVSILAELGEELSRVRERVELRDPLLTMIDAAMAIFEVKYGDTAYGEQLLSRVLATGHAPFEAVLARGELFLEQGRIVAGRAQLLRAAELSPLDPRPPAILAESYLAERDFSGRIYAGQLAELSARNSEWAYIPAIELLAEVAKRGGEGDAAELFTARSQMLRAAESLQVEYVEQANETLRKLRTAKLAVA